MAMAGRRVYVSAMETSAIIVAVMPHGEHGAVIRVLGADGLVAAYVPGGRSRSARPVLQPGNGVGIRLRARSPGALPTAAVELVRARTALATERATAAAVDYLAALLATVLDEGVPQPRLHAALDGLLDAMSFAARPADWLPGVVRFELLLLAELGFGLDLSTCAATGMLAADAELAYVSPKSSHAVGRAAGEPYAAKLLPLPAFLVSGGAGSAADIAGGFRTTGWFLERDVLIGRAAGLLAARGRLIGLV